MQKNYSVILKVGGTVTIADVDSISEIQNAVAPFYFDIINNTMGNPANKLFQLTVNQDLYYVKSNII